MTAVEIARRRHVVLYGMRTLIGTFFLMKTMHDASTT